MSITMGDLGDYMMLPGVDPSFVSGRPGQYTPEARAVMNAAVMASALRSSGHPEQPPLPLPQGALPCCPPDGMLQLCSQQDVTPNTLDVTPQLLRYATGDMTPGVSPNVVWGQAGTPDLNALMLKSPVQAVRQAAANVYTPAQEIAFTARRVQALNMATGGEQAQMLKMAQAYTTPAQMLGLGATGVKQILRSARPQRGARDRSGSHRGRGEAADLTQRYGVASQRTLGAVQPSAAESNAVGGIVSALRSAREQADLANYAEAQDAIDYAVRDWSKLANKQLAMTYQEQINGTKAYLAAMRRRTPVQVAAAQARFGGRVAVAEAAARAETERATRERDCEAQPLEPSTWFNPIKCWVKDNAGKLALGAAGLVAAGMALSYAKGRGGRR